MPVTGNGLIFSYFVRNEIKFIVHQNSAIIRDNFYLIIPTIDIFLMSALLNNYYTFYQLEKQGKKYGAGLLKLQRYDIKNLMFPDISLLTPEDITALITYAQELSSTGNELLLEKITLILEKVSAISASKIRHEYLLSKHNRLEKK